MTQHPDMRLAQLRELSPATHLPDLPRTRAVLVAQAQLERLRRMAADEQRSLADQAGRLVDAVELLSREGGGLRARVELPLA